LEKNARIEVFKQAESRLKDEIVRSQTGCATLEHKLDDKEQTIDRLNSRLQNLDKIGGALEEKGDQLNQLDSQFHKEREIRLVVEKELKILTKENFALGEKIDAKEK
jgi:CII-binding regulator of phage lambda lysogenization HflD